MFNNTIFPEQTKEVPTKYVSIKKKINRLLAIYYPALVIGVIVLALCI